MKARDLIFDDEPDLFTRAQPPAPPAPPPESARPTFDEPCAKCGGSGRFVRSRRSSGPCFACQGTGKRSYVRSAEERAQARVQRAERKARTRAEEVEAFKTAHPDVWAWMDGNTYPFAVSMREALEQWGDLTERQLAASKSAAAKLLASRESARAEVTAAPQVDASAMRDVFRRLSESGLRRIKVLIRTYAFEPSYKYKDSVAVMSGGRFLGRIDEGGRMMGFRCEDAMVREIAEIAADPRAAALAHGIKTRQCAICGAELTHPDSVARGIGPICAGRAGW